MDKTPVKESKTVCCICLQNNERVHKLNGKKLEEENFKAKLDVFLDKQVLVALYACDNSSVCRSCYGRIIKYSAFVNDAKNSVSSYLLTARSRESKRSAPSPLTPKSISDSGSVQDSETIAPSRKLRKQLRYDDIDDDHSYVSDTKVIEIAVMIINQALVANGSYSLPFLCPDLHPLTKPCATFAFE